MGRASNRKLVAAGAVPPAGVLPAGLSLLSALGRLCRSNEASLLSSLVKR